MSDAQAKNAAASNDDLFASFVVGLAGNALVHLGSHQHPETGAIEQNLEMARHTVDILGMLETKTRGNLTEPEEHILRNTLYDLRMRFIDCCGDKTAEDAPTP